MTRHRTVSAPADRTDEWLPAVHGELPRWTVDDLPAPPHFSARNVLKVIGPGAIMAATSIGGGEWLVGPAAAVKYSTSIFLIASIAIVLQVILTLFNGFWILFKTQLGNTDILVRTVTDALWMSSSRAREWKMGIRAIYYGILIIFSVWGVFVIRSASPFQLFKILANMAGIVLMIAGVQIFLVNRRFLPRALRPALWRELGLLLCSAFYAFFAYFVVRDLLRSVF